VELPKKRLSQSLPRYYEPVGTFSYRCQQLGLWYLEIGISCTYSNPVVTGGRKHTHTRGRGMTPRPPSRS
jgi:hypothetical protein